ncbi:hypothetical protein HDA32_004195 [Spinactinospora alkalitolerans]|uniref:Uncharacterized protein n=1 Tax=Spinactinospora alkalitolerans TaxID=687207 RepID=A0A852U0K5_9ACTN|nr:hypothetical protein [Spinactinospora alkalitolerans]NYE49075.1 hypothetical protein [Spinactinospora alkalitolerans]
MTEPFDDRFEERLRAAMSAEADSVQPSPDALDRIRTRTERNRMPWFGLTWLRPAVAVAAAALIVGSVLLGTPQIRDQVLPDSMTAASESQETGSNGDHADDTFDGPVAPETETDQERDRPSREGAQSPSPEPGPSGSDDAAGMTTACTPPQQDPTPGEARTLEESEEEAAPAESCAPSPDPTDPGAPSPGDDDQTGDGDDGGRGDGDGDDSAPDPEDTPEPEPEPTDGGEEQPSTSDQTQ